MKLLISLGHNASAILVDKHDVLCAYEEERLSKVKSDSSYPILAIEEILKHFPEACKEVKEVLVSHWFWITGTQMHESKYWKPKHIKARFPTAVVDSVDTDFTHHDAHARSVWNFSETKAGLTIVSDGFGTNGETLSVYRNGRLINRKFDLSLGLMYQYMTSHLGMKENQDEYKMLGLESHIEEPAKLGLDKIAFNFADRFFDNWVNTNKTKFDGIFDVCMFNKARLETLIEELLFNNKYEKAYVIQQVLELVVSWVIEDYIEPDDKILQFAGGIFYNVKLNNVILNRFSLNVDKIEFMPLAGDQGAALGMTDLKFDHVFWGIRDVNYEHYDETDEIHYSLVGNMEFGPRALGNTSCTAAPTFEMTEKINSLNGRPTIMPMAPMISPELAKKYCKHIDILGKCKHFMICATDWLGPIDKYRGVLHRKPCSDVYTCRPQVVDNVFTQQNGICINTSLNAHGQPILFDMRDFNKMCDIHEQNNKDS